MFQRPKCLQRDDFAQAGRGYMRLRRPNANTELYDMTPEGEFYVEDDDAMWCANKGCGFAGVVKDFERE